jgi:hypothetical protein
MSQQGRNGQWLFAQLCTDPNSRTGAVVNLSQDDMHGWDHILEITPPVDKVLPADLQTPVIASFAQIKTTRGKKLETKVKLSNALKAAKSPLPSFVFLFHYQSGAKPILYGRHIWKDEIAHYLKRGRQAGTEPLNKKWVTIKFSDADLLSCRPADWVMAVLTTVSGISYARAKSEIVESVGYEETTHLGKFNFGPLGSPDDMVLHEIGLLEDLPFTDLKLFDQRFGLTSEVPTQEFTEGRVSFTREGKPLTVKLISCNDDEFDIPALAWAPFSIPTNSPEFRVRIKAGHINFIISPTPEKQNVSLQLDTTEPYPMLEQIGFLALEYWSSLGPVKAQIITEQGMLYSISLDLTDTFEQWAAQLWHCGKLAFDILGKDRCKNIEISLRDLFGTLKGSCKLGALMSNQSIRVAATFENPLPEFQKLCGYSYGELGGWTYGAIHELDHSARSREGRLCCTKRVRDSCRESSVVAGLHEQTYISDLQNHELG